MGLPGERGRPADEIARADHGGVRTTQQPLGDGPQSHFGGPQAGASRPGKRASGATATRKAGATLKLAGSRLDPSKLKKALQPFFKPHSGDDQQQNPCKDAGSQNGPGQRVDLRHELALLLGHVFFSGIEKDLIVFLTREETPPKQQTHEYGGSNSPRDQQIEQRP